MFLRVGPSGHTDTDTGDEREKEREPSLLPLCIIFFNLHSYLHKKVDRLIASSLLIAALLRLFVFSLYFHSHFSIINTGQEQHQMSRINNDPDKGDPFNRNNSLELDRLDNNHNHQAAANRYQIDPLSDSSDSDNDDDLDAIDEHHTLTGKKEALLKKHHTDDHHHHPSSTSSDDSNLSQSHHHDTDTDTIDVHIIPLSSSEAIDRQRGDLQKNVTFSNGLTLVVGVIIGSGIFASPGPVFAYSKSVGVSLIIWFVSGLLAFAGSLCYAELGSAMPSSGGGEHAYLNHAFGSLPAFLFSWSSIALLKVTICSYVGVRCRCFFFN